MTDQTLAPPRRSVLARMLKALGDPLDRALRQVLPHRLFARSLLIVVAPLVLAQIATSYIFMERHFDVVTKRLSNAVAGEIALVVDTIEALEGTARTRFIIDAESSMGMLITLQPGQRVPPLAFGWSDILDRTIDEQFAERIDRPYWFNTRGRNSHVEVRVQTNDGILQILVRKSRVYATNWHIFLVWMIGTSAVLLIVAVLFLRNQIRPIQRLSIAAEAFGTGRNVPDFKPAGALEVRRAALAFMEMRNRIERHIQQRTEMLAGVSHDLRTPITRMKLELAMMKQGPEIEALQADVADMEGMLEAYLAFARGEGDERGQRIDLAELLEQTAQSFGRNGKSVRFVGHDPVSSFVRPTTFRRCLNNLVANATTYAEHTELSIDASDPDCIDLCVDDDGPGIPPDMREEAFRPFHRLDHARDPNQSGTGLGLAIALDTVRAHGGELTLEDSPLGGLRARIRLPR